MVSPPSLMSICLESSPSALLLAEVGLLSLLPLLLPVLVFFLPLLWFSVGRGRCSLGLRVSLRSGLVTLDLVFLSVVVGSFWGLPVDVTAVAVVVVVVVAVVVVDLVVVDLVAIVGGRLTLLGRGT